MSLKAVLFDFNGVIINDEAIHRGLIEDLLVSENLRPEIPDYTQICLGRSDRACLMDLLMQRGRMVTEAYVDKLVQKKAAAYQQQLDSLDKLPLYPGLEDAIYQFRTANLKLAVVTGARRSEVELVLGKANLAQFFSVIVSSEDLPLDQGKPEPDLYLLAVERLQQQFPELDLKPENCLAIEDSFAGIMAAQAADIPVAGVAHTFPYQMIHRRADWAVDYLTELTVDWLSQRYEPVAAGA
jgi:beta-phosphoglucomutase